MNPTTSTVRVPSGFGLVVLDWEHAYYLRKYRNKIGIAVDEVVAADDELNAEMDNWCDDKKEKGDVDHPRWRAWDVLQLDGTTELNTRIPDEGTEAYRNVVARRMDFESKLNNLREATREYIRQRAVFTHEDVTMNANRIIQGLAELAVGTCAPEREVNDIISCTEPDMSPYVCFVKRN